MGVLKVNLTVVDGPEKGKSFTFTEPENFLLGRNAEGSQAHLRLSPDDVNDKNNMNEIADSLLAEVNNSGGRDNISLILVEV